MVWFGLVLFLLQYKTWVNSHEKRFSFDLGIVSHNHDINKGNKDIIWSVNERMQTWYSSANTWESYRIETEKSPFDIIPINSTEVTQNRLVPSKHFTDWRKLNDQLDYQRKDEYFNPFIFKANYRAFDLISS